MSDAARLYKIEPDCTYILTYQGHLSPQDRQQIKDDWERATSSRLVILTNVTVAEVPA